MSVPSSESHAPLSTAASASLPRRALARSCMALGAIVLLLSQAGLMLGIEPFPTWFYVFAWWSWILFADGLVHLRTGSSLLISRPRSFLILLPWSLAFWLFYEAVNFILLDWYYVAVPVDPIERLIGISISFATVLPGVMETVDLLGAFGFPKHRERRPFRFSSRGLGWLFLTGTLFLALPLFFPNVAYPLIWGALVLLIEPLLYRAGKRGYLTQFREGDYSVLWRYLVAGLCCGLLWEFWNFWATAKWIYTVPFFEEGKLFEMPVLGFLGYPPFALGIYTFVRGLVALQLCPEFERATPPLGGRKSSTPEQPLVAHQLDPKAAVPPAESPAHRERAGRSLSLGRYAAEIQIVGVAIALYFSSLVLPAVQRLTVRSTAPTIPELFREQSQLQLAISGDHASFGELVDAVRGGDFANTLGLGEFERDQLLAEADLMLLAGMGRRGVAWLESIAIYNIEDLAAVTDEELVDAVLQHGSGPPPMPYAREIRVWRRHAVTAIEKTKSADESED